MEVAYSRSKVDSVSVQSCTINHSRNGSNILNDCASYLICSLPSNTHCMRVYCTGICDYYFMKLSCKNALYINNQTHVGISLMATLIPLAGNMSISHSIVWQQDTVLIQYIHGLQSQYYNTYLHNSIIHLRLLFCLFIP